MLALSGCAGNTPVPRPAEPERARLALREALDSWKGGAPHDAPGRRTPPLVVADDDWLAGARLLDYQVGPDDRPVGTALRCPVVLTIKDKKGRTTKKRVYYNVGTDPTVMVVRQDAP